MSRIPAGAHRQQAWRIHAIAPDFTVEDVWDFAVPGAGQDDFGLALDRLRRGGGPNTYSAPTRFLWSLRWRLGALLRLDGDGQGLGARVPSVRDRLPEDLLAQPRPSGSSRVPMTGVYQTRDEAVQELANRTVHALMHLGWVEHPGGYHLQMAVLVKPNGLWGRAYLAFIKPFRYLVVYPSLTRSWERAMTAPVVPAVSPS